MYQGIYWTWFSDYVLNTIFFFSKISHLLFFIFNDFYLFQAEFKFRAWFYTIEFKREIFFLYILFISIFHSPPPPMGLYYTLFPINKSGMPIGGYKFYRDLHIACMESTYWDRSSNLYLLYQEASGWIPWTFFQWLIPI